MTIVRRNDRQHHRRKPSPGFVETRLDRTDSASGHGADLLVGQVVVLAQDDDLAVRRFQALEVPVHEFDALALFESRQWTVHSTFGRYPARVRGLLTVAASDSVEALVARDRVEPGPESTRRQKPLTVFEDAYERVLQGVQRLVPVSEHFQTEAVDPRLVSIVDRHKG